MWNNPHNMWANFALDTVYNGNWFGQWINKIDRSRGTILDSITVGEAPTHIITIPTPGAETGVLTIPLSADNDMVKVRDSASGLEIIGSEPTGQGKTLIPMATGSLAAWAIGQSFRTSSRGLVLPVQSALWTRQAAVF